jgi:hypothetical protein
MAGNEMRAPVKVIKEVVVYEYEYERQALAASDSAKRQRQVTMVR